jgi:hypothetical protein
MWTIRPLSAFKTTITDPQRKAHSSASCSLLSADGKASLLFVEDIEIEMMKNGGYQEQ